MKMKKNKKKILYLITKSNWGGAQRYVYDLATHLPKDKFEPVVAAGGNGILLKKLNDAGIRTVHIPSLERDVAFLKELRAFRAIFQITRNEKPDILHLNSPKAAGLGAVAGRITRVPRIVQTIHGWSFNEDRPFIWRALTWLFSCVTALFVQKSIVVSKHDLQQAKYMPLAGKRATHIGIAIAEQKLLTREDARKQISEIQDIPKGDSAIWIGTIAELHKNKGLQYGVDAIRKAREKNRHIYWVLISDGEEKKKLQKLVKEKGVQKHVFFLGYVDNAAQYMKAFDIFMLPSVKEGLPYVLLEAHAAGLPIVATDVGGIPEVVRDKAGIVVPPKNHQKLADAIELLLANPVKVSEKESEFTKMLEKTTALY